MYIILRCFENRAPGHILSVDDTVSCVVCKICNICIKLIVFFISDREVTFTNLPNYGLLQKLHSCQIAAMCVCVVVQVCPVCAAMPWGNPLQTSINFLQHLNLRHKFEYETYVVSSVAFGYAVSEVVNFVIFMYTIRSGFYCHFIIILRVCLFLGYCQCHLWTYNPVHSSHM